MKPALQFVALLAISLCFVGGNRASAAVIAPVLATRTAGGSEIFGPAAGMIDGNGLSGIGAVETQLHSESPFSGSMFLASGTTVTLVFELDAVYNLGQMIVWNYAEAAYPFNDDAPYGLGNSYTARGANLVRVYLSETDPNPNGSYQEYNFTRATPPLTVNNRIDGPNSGLDFGTAANTYAITGSARYIKFEILSNFGLDPLGENYVGLSEVRFATAAVPEPTAFLMGIMGMLGIGIVRRRFAKA